MGSASWADRARQLWRDEPRSEEAGSAANNAPATCHPPPATSSNSRALIRRPTHRSGGRPFDTYYPGPRPFSERETRIARNLILRLHPRVTIWYHQHMNLIWAYGPSSAAGRTYARVVGMRFYHHHWLRGTATNWQNHHLPHTSSFTVELPAGSLSPAQVRRHVRAVLRLGAA